MKYTLLQTINMLAGVSFDKQIQNTFNLMLRYEGRQS